jgi:molecular chaperone DnaJ
MLRRACLSVLRRPIQMSVSGSRPLAVLSRAALPQQQHPGSSCKCRHFRATSVTAEKADYYELLGISRDASASEVKKAYYKAAKKHHPDTNKGDENAAKKFAEATEAYEVLSDAGQKQKYDAYGHADGGGQAGGGGFGGGGNPFGGGGFPGFGFGGGQSPEDIFAQFDQMFSEAGRRQRGPRGPPRGQDVQAQVSLDFLQAVSGGKKTNPNPDPNANPTLNPHANANPSPSP